MCVCVFMNVNERSSERSSSLIRFRFDQSAQQLVHVVLRGRTLEDTLETDPVSPD